MTQNSTTPSPIALRDLGLPPPASLARESSVPMERPLGNQEEWLPFTVEVVRDEASLYDAVRVRQQAYSRHLPAFSATLSEPEPADLQPGVAVLLARSKLDGSPLGSMRIQTNESGPLPLESSVELPPSLRGAYLAEATRLGVTQEPVGSLVKTAIFKAFFLYCMRLRVDHMVVTGRAPIDRQYMRLLFEDVFPDRGMIPMRHVGNLPHRIMALNLHTVERVWHEAKHPLTRFVFHTHHPDLKLAQQVRRTVPRLTPLS